MDTNGGSIADYHFDQAIHMQLVDGGHVAEATDMHGYAIAAPAMCSGQHFIKCCIDKAGPSDWIFLGVTGHSDLNNIEGCDQKHIEDDHTTFGWTTFAHYVAGEFVPSRAPRPAGSIQLPKWSPGHDMIFKVVLSGQAGYLCMGCLHSACVLELKLHFAVASNISFVVGAALGTLVHISSATAEDWQQVKDFPTIRSSTPLRI